MNTDTSRGTAKTQVETAEESRNATEEVLDITFSSEETTVPAVNVSTPGNEEAEEVKNWSHDDTLKLIELFTENHHRFESSKEKSGKVWRDIARHFTACSTTSVTN